MRYVSQFLAVDSKSSALAFHFVLSPESRVLSPAFMILEVAVLNLIPGREAEFEHAFRQAQRIISSMSGYRFYDALSCRRTLHLRGWRAGLTR